MIVPFDRYTDYYATPEDVEKYCGTLLENCVMKKVKYIVYTQMNKLGLKGEFDNAKDACQMGKRKCLYVRLLEREEGHMGDFV